MSISSPTRRATRGALAALTAGLSAVALAACAPSASSGETAGPDTGVTVRVLSVGTAGTSAGFMFGDLAEQLAPTGATAEETGYFPASAPLLEALNAGAGDIGYLVSSAALTALSGDSDFKILAIAQEDADVAGSSSSIVVPDGSDITSVDDLVGKSVAVNQGGAGEYILDAALLNRGIDPSSVTKVYLGPGDAAAAFTNGSVDAWAAFSTFIPAAVDKMGARILTTGVEELQGKFDQAILVVRTAFLDEHPELMQPIVDAFVAGSEKIKADPTEYLSIQQDVNGLSDAQVDYLEETLTVFAPFTDETRAQLQSMIDLWYEAGTLPVQFDVNDIVVDLNTL